MAWRDPAFPQLCLLPWTSAWREPDAGLQGASEDGETLSKEGPFSEPRGSAASSTFPPHSHVLRGERYPLPTGLELSLRAQPRGTTLQVGCGTGLSLSGPQPSSSVPGVFA